MEMQIAAPSFARFSIITLSNHAFRAVLGALQRDVVFD